tara:strand:+ start:2914 stop:4425 length:1512 start_codon:yes stop_codon:yes gene_type:complete
MARQTRIDPKTNPEEYSYGSNELGSREIFFERLKYDTYIFPNFLADNFVSTWTTERNYGTINNRGNAVIPHERRLKSMRFSAEGSSTKYALDFVVDAWHDFAKRARALASQNVTFKDSPWASPEVVKAWVPAQRTYDSYLRENVYPVFYDNFLYTGDRNQKVTNIHDFIKQFDEFMQDYMIKAGPVSLSGYIESTYAPVYSSGLVIEIASEDYDDDFNKSYKFGDRNFSLIASIAAQYGFSIDKNIPWRLVADLRNPAMLEYMLGVPIEGFDIADNIEYLCEPLVGGVELPPMAYGYSQIPGLENLRRNIAFFAYDNEEGQTFQEPGYQRYKRFNGTVWEPVFNTTSQPEAFEAMFAIDYNETWREDMNLLEEYILFFYNYYVVLQPSVTRQTQVSFNSTCGPRTYTLTREQVTLEQFKAAYGDRWKLKTYYVIRDKERSRPITLKRRMYEIQRIMNNYNLGANIDPASAYSRALEVLQEDFIGPADRGPLTLDTIGDIISSK